MITSVRLDVEQNELVSVVAQVGFEMVCCKAHEICVFQRLRRRESVDKVERDVELEFFLDDGEQDIGDGAPNLRLNRVV
jgi:hypothetical protein